MRNRQNIIGVAATCAVVFIATAVGANAQQDNPAFNAGVKAAQQDAQFVQGVQASADDALLRELLTKEGPAKPKYGPNNELLSIYIVVREDFPKSMPANRAETFASKRAAIAARAEFVKFIKTECKVKAGKGDEMIVQGKGSGTASSEESVDNRDFREANEEQAQGLVRGIVSITQEVDPERGKLTAIYGWSVKSAGGAASAEAINNQGAPVSQGARSESQSPTTQNAGQTTPQLNQNSSPKARKALSSGISDF